MNELLNDTDLDKLFNSHIDKIAPILTELREIAKAHHMRMRIETTPDGYFDFHFDRRKSARKHV